jgi:hypothetical protein
MTSLTGQQRKCYTRRRRCLLEPRGKRQTHLGQLARNDTHQELGLVRCNQVLRLARTA